ncbi:hypothetical protein B0H10DRAFT_1962608 [Mycena sp. CBHHK59/15]|nr:hypothetical protein B0H10DRAFT_1962608 [Mycena sp. CBHHK59/15]
MSAGFLGAWQPRGPKDKKLPYGVGPFQNAIDGVAQPPERRPEKKFGPLPYLRDIKWSAPEMDLDCALVKLERIIKQMEILSGSSASDASKKAAAMRKSASMLTYKYLGRASQTYVQLTRLWLVGYTQTSGGCGTQRMKYTKTLRFST